MANYSHTAVTARVRRIDGPTYGDLWRESPTAIAPDMWNEFSRCLWGRFPRITAAEHPNYRTWATMYVRPTREVA